MEESGIRKPKYYSSNYEIFARCTRQSVHTTCVFLRKIAGCVHCRYPRFAKIFEYTTVIQCKEERFNGSLKREMLNYKEIRNLIHAQAEFDEYRRFYNNERPHHALNLELPVNKYQRSERKYNPKIEKWEYDSKYIVRKLKRSGYLTFKGQGFFISEAFGEQYVGIRESTKENGVYRINFRQFCIASVNTNERVVTSRKPFKVKTGVEQDD